MLFPVSVLHVSCVGVTDPDDDVSSHYIVFRVGVTVPDDDVSSL